MSDDKVLQLNSGVWSFVSQKQPKGISVNNITKKFCISHSNGTNVYSNDNGVLLFSYPHNDSSYHMTSLLSDDSVCVSSFANSCVFKFDSNGNVIDWKWVDENGVKRKLMINGISYSQYALQYVTALAEDTPDAPWRNSARESKGVLFDVVNNKIVFDNLMLPHTPLVIGNDLFFLNSGHGEICRWTIGNASYDVVANAGAWVRGMCQIADDYLVIGVSQGRETAFPELTINQLAQPGLSILEISTGNILEFESLDVKEIFDLAIVNTKINV
jgi:uncharacterized protein (TIGR03032 family)